MAASGRSYRWPRSSSTRLWWLTPNPSSTRSGKASVRPLTPPVMVTASRAQMLAMPVHPTRRWVADSRRARCIMTSRPATSGSQIAP